MNVSRLTARVIDSLSTARVMDRKKIGDQSQTKAYIRAQFREQCSSLTFLTVRSCISHTTMEYKLLSAIVLGALATLPVSGNVIHLVRVVADYIDAVSMPVFTSAHHACGEGGEVLTNTTFTSKNKEVRVVTQACPGFVDRRSFEKRITSRNVQKRQDLICSYDGNTFTLATHLVLMIDVFQLPSSVKTWAPSPCSPGATISTRL